MKLSKSPLSFAFVLMGFFLLGIITYFDESDQRGTAIIITLSVFIPLLLVIVEVNWGFARKIVQWVKSKIK
jgi:hypothetical protein